MSRHGSRSSMIPRAQKALDNVKAAMRKSGYEIGDIVRVKVDPNLDFMGYTMPLDNGTYQIVVSGASLDSGMLEGLLTHEMCHVYRMKTLHPSHDATLIEDAVSSFGQNVAKRDYQQKIIHDILNDIQDLYADDIAFKVLGKTEYISPIELSRFLQSWVKDEPYVGEGREMAKWMNGALLVHNARALAQMRRHNIADTGSKATKMNERLLSKMPSFMTKNFDYFEETLGSLDENISPEAYRSLLKRYIGKFLEMVGEYP